MWCKLQYFLNKNVCFTGLYINELFYRLLQEQDIHQYLYQQYQQFMAILCDAQPDEVRLRQLEMTLLEELGYGLVLDCEGQTGTMLDYRISTISIFPSRV